MHATNLSTLNMVTPPAVSVPLSTWLQRMRTRAVLRQLDARALADIGRSEAERQCECAKWFWQA